MRMRCNAGGKGAIPDLSVEIFAGGGRGAGGSKRSPKKKRRSDLPPV